MNARSRSASRDTTQKVIRSESDIRDGVRVLRRRCAVLRSIHERAGDPPLRRYSPDYAGLARIVVGQQLSIASAAAIWARLERSLSVVTPEAIARARPATLAAAGLSAAKIKTLKALADAVLARPAPLALEDLERADDEAVRAALIQVHGIGPWTADIFIMFCLGRADAWAAGDLALQVGVARAFGRGERLSAEDTVDVAERWRPWRGVAARLIWADYANLRVQRQPMGSNPLPARSQSPRVRRKG